MKPHRRRRAAFLVTVAVILATAAVWSARPRQVPGALSADVVSFLADASGSAGFARVTGPQPLDFARDAGPHPDYQTEWWYYTGNLAEASGNPASFERGSAISDVSGNPISSESGIPASTERLSDPRTRRFGFQLTFFRRAIAPPSTAPTQTTRASRWATNQIYLAHFAVTDVAGGTYQSAERTARGGAGLAGAVAAPYRVWLESWWAQALAGMRTYGGGSMPGPTVGPTAGLAADAAPLAGPTVRLVASDPPVALDLTTIPLKPPALHGESGYSRKGSAPGNASMYYSYTRLGASGRITTPAGTFPVAGTAWMDHEWSTSALEPGQVGWDWFSLQLDDGWDIMAFQMRQQDGGTAPSSSGSLVDPAGRVTRLGKDDFAIGVGGTWQSPRTGAHYPAKWHLALPAQAIDLHIEPLASDQELDVAFKYWEGAVRVTGTRAGRPVGGYGYVELTGYAPSGSSPGLGGR